MTVMFGLTSRRGLRTLLSAWLKTTASDKGKVLAKPSPSTWGHCHVTTLLPPPAAPPGWPRNKRTVMSESTLLPRPGLYLGGLRSDLHPARLAGLIASLLAHYKVSCPKNHIHIAIGKDHTYALVDLPDEESKHYLLAELSDISNILTVFDLHAITNNPYDFRAAPRIVSRSKKKRSRSRAKKNRRNRSNSPEDANAAGGPEEDLFMLYNTAQTDWLQTPKKQANGERAVNHRSISPQARTSKSQCEDQQRKTGKQDDENPDRLLGQTSQTKTLVNLRESSNQSGNSIQGGGNLTRVPALLPIPRERTLQMASVDSLRPVSSAHGVLNQTQKTAATSTTGLPAPAQVSTTTSTPGTLQGLSLAFYRLGGVVGRESRHSEFKAGGMVFKERGWLQDTVGKYVCGFLNSTEGGVLYIGVNDSGKVIGFPCTQAQEDDFRLLIDEALKNIEPTIFPDKYKVRFVPVMQEDGQLSDTLQVLEVQVLALNSLKNLYLFRDNAYMRRDGSLQGPLKARQVQEWTRKQLEQEQTDSWQLKSQLHQVVLQLEVERRKNDEMRQKLEDLEDRHAEVPLEKKKSKICALM